MFAVVHAESWESARALSRRMSGWCFRGQSDATWPLATTFERKASQYSCLPRIFGNRERWILREFRRRAHHYLPAPPGEDQILEWLALLQHHGGPSRLLDWTYSFYVAAYFAMESANTDAAVWAINLSHLNRQLEIRIAAAQKQTTRDLILKRNSEIAERLLDSAESQPFVLHVEPHRLSERMSIQQGTFLLAADIRSSFVVNLAAAWSIDPATFSATLPVTLSATETDIVKLSDLRVMKVIIPRGRHGSALTDLWRMNVHSGTLFSGLDGFARSLAHHLRIFDRDDEAMEILGL